MIFIEYLVELTIIPNVFSRVPSVAICSFTFCYIWLNWLELPSEKLIEDYKLAVTLIGVSCMIESFVEPVYIFSQAFLYVQWRVSTYMMVGVNIPMTCIITVF